MTNPSTRRLVYLLGFIAVVVVGSLALPIEEWRTGETPLPELHYLSAAAPTVKADRLWVDADAACGTGKRRDPDDCLALLSLVAAKNLHIVGISTVFGNAPVAETDAVMRALAAELGRQGGPVLPVFLGCGAAAVLRQEPGLARNITRVIAVMGRRPSHRFHPSENRAPGAMLFGHGPIFRDLNAVLVPEAVAIIL